MNEEKNTTQNSVQKKSINQYSSRNKRVLALILTVTIIVIAGTVSYAFLPTDNLPIEPQDAQASTATLKLKYTDCASTNQSDCADISADLHPGDSITKTFEVENVGTQDVEYGIYFRELENTFKNGDLVYTLENLTTGEIIVQEKNVPFGNRTNVVINKKASSPVGNKVQYKLTVTFLNRDYEQSNNYDATFNLKLKIGEAKSTPTSIMMARADDQKLWAHGDDIKTITFENSLSEKANAAYTYDISEKQDNSVMAYLVPTETDTTKYDVYIQGNGGVLAPSNSSNLFYNFTGLVSINSMEYFDTSNVTNMEAMFMFCEALMTLDVTNFDTSNISNMVQMFFRCINLTSLDVGNFDTINVTDMDAMFLHCDNLTSLDVNNFDTSNVTDMSYLFSYCSSLNELSLNNLDTSNVTSMRGMFRGCYNLTNINISDFDTSKVTGMSYMFEFCLSLTSLDMSNFNTSNVTDMNSMFDGCSGLTSLDLSNFDTSKVTDMSYMFRNCIELTVLDLSNFDTSKVTNMSYMFCSCDNLTTTITIMSTNCTKYDVMFNDAAIKSSAQITVNYTSDASSLVDSMIATKSSGSNVVKGSVVS